MSNDSSGANNDQVKVNSQLDDYEVHLQVTKYNSYVSKRIREYIISPSIGTLTIEST